jgi:hypothetical protein
MFDGIGSSEKEGTFDGLGSATGAPTPMVHMIDRYAAGMRMMRSICRLNPFLAPFVPKEPE